ncbi:universal stress protein [Pseudoruegeria sp. HB172150]|uniref:universal stress protein n=1 Tax=Pseudoruegeria sp. HB172150 TaxID=2721164 RepID=UPI001552E080|nr:universal stress protein [Pseudoruegeria sp. HB172150]
MYKHILIPVALDHEHTPEEAVGVAKSLLSEGGKITALHVMEPLPGYAAQYLPAESHDTRVANQRKRMQEAFGEGTEVEMAVLSGQPGRSIVEYAAEKGVDLIVIASHRPGLQDYFLGSTAGRVVRHAQCCVHVLR